jgi:hypothetical protein
MHAHAECKVQDLWFSARLTVLCQQAYKDKMKCCESLEKTPTQQAHTSELPSGYKPPELAAQ